MIAVHLHLLTAILLALSTVTARSAEPKTTASAAVPSPAQIQAAAPSQSTSLSALFSTDSNPGSGTLEYGSAQPAQKIQLGAQHGFFGMGVAFPTSTLPDTIARDLGQRAALQIVFGTLRSKLTVEVPQFAALTLFTAKLPARAITFPMRLPEMKKTKAKDFALMLFSEPTTSADQPDEEKLKRTFFGVTGNTIAQMVGPRKVVEISNRGTKIPFQVQTVKLEIRSTLATPFNTEEVPLKGTVEVPLYWSEDKRGLAMMKHIARDSFGANSSIGTPKVAPTKKTLKKKLDQ